MSKSNLTLIHSFKFNDNVIKFRRVGTNYKRTISRMYSIEEQAKKVKCFDEFD